MGNVSHMKCTCKGRPILDEDGNYSLALLEGHDSEWHFDVLTGIEWEELSWKMDEEEPQAALDISVAFNKKNEVAMKIGHLEILVALAGLCTPDPKSGTVEYIPVRDRLIDLYGSAVDHPEFIYLFRFVLMSGGATSVHLANLKEFTTIFVNQHIRKMQMTAYVIVSRYPVKIRRVSNASLKWAWRQTTKLGWCPLPPCILHRLDEDSKYEWEALMDDIEEAFTAAAKLAFTVVEMENSPVAKCDKLKQRTLWVASVEIEVMGIIF